MAAELSGTSERNVQAIFQRLANDHLVYGKSYEHETYTRGALPKAFGLTDSAVAKALREGWATDSTKTFRGHALRTIEHELMISLFHLDLAKLCDEKGWDLRWRQSDLNKHPIWPDALFAINGRYFFLEIERAKLGDYVDGTPSVIRKMADYWENYASTGCEKDFGFRTFRVITVMRTLDRTRSFAKMLQQPHHLPTLKRDIPALNKATFLISSEAGMFSFISAKDLSQVSFDSIVT